MEKILTRIKLKKLLILTTCTLFISFLGYKGYGQSCKRSVINSKWTHGGIFEGFKPEQEILEKRSRNVKHFKNADGTITAQMGGLTHYKDKHDAWQDVDFSIKSNSDNSSIYKFSNETNEIKSYFPLNANSKNILIQISDDLSFTWWNSPKLKFVENGTVLNVFNPSSNNGNVEGEQITYPNVYNGISEQFVVIEDGIENNTIIDNLSSEIVNLPNDAIIEFSQYIPIQHNWIVEKDGAEINSDFEADYFSIKIPGIEQKIYFKPIVVFDNSVTKNKAFELIDAPIEKLNNEQKNKLDNHIFKSKYKISFVSGGIILSLSVPVSWLKENYRVFPVTIDPLVELLTSYTQSSSTVSGMPYNTYYHDQRYDFLLLASDLTSAGISTGSVISTIGLYCYETSGQAISNFRIRTQFTTATTYTAWLTSGWTVNYGPVSAGTPVAGNWYDYTLTSNITTTTDNLAVNISRDNTAYTSGGGNYVRGTFTSRAIYGYSDSGYSWPYDGMSVNSYSYLPCIRMTYTVPCAAPSISVQPVSLSKCAGQSATFSVTATCASGAISYQWRKNGTNIGGATSSSYTIPSVVAGDAGSYDVVVTCACGSNPTTTSSAATLTVSGSTPDPAGTITGTPSICLGQSGVAYSVAAITNATSYVWSYSGTGATIVGTSNNITINFNGSATSGNLTVYGQNSCGNGTISANYPIQTLDVPVIITNPVSTSIGCNGTAVTFYIEATGAGLTYQWQKNGVNISDGVVYSGCTTETLTINDPTGLTGSTFRCVITGTCGSATSTSATLTVLGSGLSGTKTVGTLGDYATLKAAFDAINANGLIGNLDLKIISDITDNNEASLNQWNSCGNSGYTVTVYPGTAARTLSGSVATSLVTLNGADKVTFDGRIDKTGAANSLILSNTNTAGSTLKFINDACGNVIQYCNLRGVSTGAVGTINFNTGVSSGNSNNNILYCSIYDGATTPQFGLYAIGTVGAENKDNTISNSNIYNFYRSGGYNSFGIYISSGNTRWKLLNNSVYQTISRTECSFYGIYIYNTSGSEFIIDGNYIGGTQPLCGGSSKLAYTNSSYACTFDGILVYLSTVGISKISNNTISNISFESFPGSSGAGIFTAIDIFGGRVDVNNNVIGDNSTSSIEIISDANSTYGAWNLAIYKDGDGNVLNNRMGSITLKGSISYQCGFNAIQVGGTLINDVIISGNVIGNETTPNSITSTPGATPNVTIGGIYFGTAGNYNTTVSNNTIANISNNCTGTGAFFVGLYNEATNGKQTVIGNTIDNISVACTRTTDWSTVNLMSALTGIASINSTNGGHSISNNTIYSLSATGSAAVQVYGIMCHHDATTGTTIEKNNIYGLSATSNSAYICGIKTYYGKAFVYNNMISLGTGLTNYAGIYGIWQVSTSACTYNFNSIYIGGTVSSGSINTFAFKREAGSSTLYNNILYNARSGGTGYHYALVTNSATVTSNYNDIYSASSTSCTSYNGGGTAITLGAWQTNTSQDGSSRSENPLYVNTTSNLHLQATSLEIGRGIAGTVLVDFDSEQRSAGVSPNGPCIGADERTTSSGKNAYGIYMPAAQATGNIVDCEIYATGGTPGGQGIKVGNPTATNWANVNISSYQVITEQNIQCMNTNIDFTTTTGSPSWLMGNGSNPSSGSTSPLTVQYSSTGRKNIIETVKLYTDFTNITMPVPSPGSILGAPSGAGCPTTYNYTSSVAGSPGFTYQWSVVVPGGCSASIANPTASSTNITFVNLTGYNQVFAVSLDITTECCGPLTRVTRYITIYPAPLPPTVLGSPFSICTGGSQPLTVNSPNGSYSYDWYNVSSGGSLLGSGIAYTVDPVLLGSNNYYVQATNSYGCTSSRTQVIVTGVNEPAPTVPSNYTCGPDNITLSISSPISGYSYNWYSGSCGGTLLQSGTSTSYSAYISSSTTYYVAAVPPGCGPGLCATVNATVNSIPNPIIWLGVVGGTNNWFNTSNWTSGCLPTCLGNVRIPSGTTFSPDIGYNAVDNAHCKDLDLQNGATLSFSDSKAELDICGNVTHAGTLTTNSLGLVKYTGSVAQTYSKTGTGNFHNVSLDNSLGLTLSSGNMILDATGAFEFINGKITTGTNYLIINNTDPLAISNYGTGKYVYGNLRRYINSGTYTYAFPVGSSLRYTLAELINTSLTGITYIDGKFVTPFTNTGTLNPATAVDFGTVYTSVATEGVWQLDPNANPTGGSYSIKLWFNDGGGSSPFSGLTDNMFAPLKRPSGSTLASDWTALGGTLNAASTPGRTVAGGYAQRTGWNSFSQYAIGIASSVLPVEMLNFDAHYNGTSVDLLWTTASEINNDYFDVEKSVDATNFTSIGEVASKARGGTSNTPLNYLYNDNEVSLGMYYYRLKQVDINGDYKYSPIVSVIIGNNGAFSMQPNPVSNSLYINYYCNGIDNPTFYIYDDNSRLVLSKIFNCSTGMNSEVINLSSLSKGVYYVVLTTQSQIYRAKLVKD